MKRLQTIQQTVGLRPAPALCKTPARSALPWLLKAFLGDEPKVWLGYGVLGSAQGPRDSGTAAHKSYFEHRGCSSQVRLCSQIGSQNNTRAPIPSLNADALDPKHELRLRSPRALCEIPAASPLPRRLEAVCDVAIWGTVFIHIALRRWRYVP